MRVIKPTIYNPSTHLVSSTATESVATYNAGTTYDQDDQVVFGDSIYASLVSANTGNTPDAIDSSFWARIGPSNRFAMFDQQVSTSTVSTTSLTVVMTPGLLNSIGMFNLVGNTLSISITDGSGGPVVYSQTVSLDTTFISDWYAYFFEPQTQLGEVVFTNIPPYINARMTITVSAASGAPVGIGSLVFGNQYVIGATEYGATVGIIDYSRKDTDEFGTTTFVRRAFSKRINANVFLPNSQLNAVQRTLSDLRATPCVWIGSDDPTFAPLLVYGFFREFSIDITYPAHSYCSLEIEGLI
jgi:hypothetical protein